MTDNCYDDVVHDLIKHTDDLDHDKYKRSLVWDSVDRKYVGYWVGIKDGQTLDDGLQLRSWTIGLAREQLGNSHKFDDFYPVEAVTNHNYSSGGEESENVVESTFYTPPLHQIETDCL